MIPITLSWPLHRSLITFEISKIFERFPFESDMQNFPLDLPIFYEDNSRISFHNYRDEIFFWRIQKKKNHESSVRFQIIWINTWDNVNTRIYLLFLKEKWISVNVVTKMKQQILINEPTKITNVKFLISKNFITTEQYEQPTLFAIHFFYYTFYFTII